MEMECSEIVSVSKDMREDHYVAEKLPVPLIQAFPSLTSIYIPADSP
jgi:hypothetical protein